MVHLAIHLSKKALLVRLIHYRWMYPIDKVKKLYILLLKLSTVKLLKSNILRNNNNPSNVFKNLNIPAK